jgi:thiamine-phosphate pyrophosphorylase
MLSGEVELSKELGFYGVHLRSDQFDKIADAKELRLFTVISTHSIEEIESAYELGADMVTFSPIFASPNKGEPKGVDELKMAVNSSPIEVIALGGIISQREIELCREAGAKGFASIRYFAI